jgi:serine kinase of HPr protein (carbohydrate metabolism regulator)
MILHANLTAYRQAGRWRGLLLRGPSGAGKSELTLRLLDRGWRLVADDRVIVWTSGGRLWGRAPDILHGLIEVRAVGVSCVPALAFVQITQVIDCASATELERIPAPATIALHGVALPFRQIDASAAAAPEKAIVACSASCV